MTERLSGVTEEIRSGIEVLGVLGVQRVLPPDLKGLRYEYD